MNKSVDPDERMDDDEGVSDLATATEWLKVLSDPVRLRLLQLLETDALTVAEMTQVTELAQSRVSSHLGRLREAGLVVDRRHGTARFYSLTKKGPAEPVQTLWGFLQEKTKDPVFQQDRTRLRQVLKSRNGTRTDRAAGRMERFYSPGRTWEAATRGVLGLASLGRVLDVASGDGALAELVAPRAREVVCLDINPQVIQAGCQRVGKDPRLRFQLGDMHAVPFADETFDQAICMSALSYAHQPSRVVAEIYRVLQPGGRVTCTTLKRHPHRDLAAKYDQQQLGFPLQSVKNFFAKAGFRIRFCAVTSREKRPPHLEIITLYADKPDQSFHD